MRSDVVRKWCERRRCFSASGRFSITDGFPNRRFGVGQDERLPSLASQGTPHLPAVFSSFSLISFCQVDRKPDSRGDKNKKNRKYKVFFYGTHEM